MKILIGGIVKKVLDVKPSCREIEETPKPSVQF